MPPSPHNAEERLVGVRGGVGAVRCIHESAALLLQGGAFAL